MTTAALARSDYNTLVRQLSDSLENKPVSWAELARCSVVLRACMTAQGATRSAAVDDLCEVLGGVSADGAKVVRSLIGVYERLTPDRQPLVGDPFVLVRQHLLDRALSGPVAPLELEAAPTPPTVMLGEEHYGSPDCSTPAAEVATNLSQWIASFPESAQYQITQDLLQMLLDQTPDAESETRMMVAEVIKALKTEEESGRYDDAKFLTLGEERAESDVCEAGRHFVVFLRGTTFDEDDRGMGDPESLREGIRELLSAEGRRGAAPFSRGSQKRDAMQAACGAIQATANNLIARVLRITSSSSTESGDVVEVSIDPATPTELTDIGLALQEGLAGDDSRLLDFYRLASELCVRQATTRLKDPHAAGDLGQDILLNVSQAIGDSANEYRPATIEGYLRAATWRRCNGYLSAESRRREIVASAIGAGLDGGRRGFLDSVPQPNDPEPRLGCDQIFTQLDSFDDQNVQTLAYWLRNDCDVPATAAHFDITPCALYVRLTRARAALRPILTEAMDS